MKGNLFTKNKKLFQLIFYNRILNKKTFHKQMGYVRKVNDGEFDFDKLPEGDYFFSGQEGFVKVTVNEEGNQSWDLQNWFASLDPDNNEKNHRKVIQDIKRRLNADTGIINPREKKKKKKSFINPFKNKNP